MRKLIEYRNKKQRDGIHSIVADKMLELLYPSRCPVCDEILPHTGERCCRICSEKLPWVAGAVCMKCGKPVGHEAQEYCEDCNRQQHYFDQGAAAFVYNGALRHSIYRMKFENRRDYLDFYAEAIVHALAKHLKHWEPEVIFPVPMHPSKKRKRGYNQSELLAQKVGRLTGIPVDNRSLRCVRRTAAQKELDRKARMKNLRGSFGLSELLPKGSRVLLVDDVYTTGSTLDEVSRVLKEGGAERVFFVVLCIGKGKKTVCIEEKL